MSHSISGQPCAMCNNPSTKICSNCHQIRYCSTDCQKADWSIHKLLCKSFDKFQDADRPAPHDGLIYKRSIVFHAAADRPEFIWLPFKPSDSNPGIAKCDTSTFGGLPFDHMAHARKVSTTNVRYPPGTAANLNPLLRRVMPHWIYSLTLVDPTEIWKPTEQWSCIKSYVAIDKEGPEKSFGTQICWARQNSDTWQNTVVDLDLLDFRNFVDTQRWHLQNMLRAEALVFEGEAVQGVRLNCHGDVFTFTSTGQYVTVEEVRCPKPTCDASSEADMFFNQITKNLGLDLIVSKVAPSVSWRDRKSLQGMHMLFNRFAGHLNGADLDIARAMSVPSADVSEEMDQNIYTDCMLLGTWVIVRKDGKPLDKTFVFDLIVYIYSKTSTFAQTQATVVPGLTWKDAVVSSVSEVDFQQVTAQHAAMHEDYQEACNDGSKACDMCNCGRV